MSLDLVYPVILFILLFVVLFVLKVFLNKSRSEDLIGQVAESSSEFEVDEKGEVRIRVKDSIYFTPLGMEGLKK